jgi:hypothetical protein
MVQFKDWSLDIETLGTVNNSVVLSCGLVGFNMKGKDTPESLLDKSNLGHSVFKCLFNVESQQRRGRRIDASTVLWWQTQSKEAQLAVQGAYMSQPTMQHADDQVIGGLKQIREIIEKSGFDCRIWGNGNMFDNTIMRSLFASYGEKYPTSFRHDLDMRTMAYLYQQKTGKNDLPWYESKALVAHNALHDAAAQALCMQRMYAELNANVTSSPLGLDL